MTIPFNGETMECVVCGAKQKSDASRSTDWRAIQVGTETFYACPADCPKELPADADSAPAIKHAFMQLIRAIVAKQERRGA